MCGILAAVGKLDISPILRSLESRGGHAWGIAYFAPTGEIVINKAPGRVPTTPITYEGTVMIGHTRFATSGNPDNNANNHPFLGGPIALAHNGVIFGNLHPKQKSACDSEVILKELLAHPLKDERQTINALKKVCAKLDGSFRVVLINKNTPNAVYVANDSERPWLHLVSKAIVITSEQDNAKGVSFQLPSNVVTVVHMDHTITQASFTPKKRATRGLDWRDYSDREDTQNRSWWTRRDDSLPDTAQDTPAPGHYPADCEGCAFAADYPAEYCQECYKGHN